MEWSASAHRKQQRTLRQRQARLLMTMFGHSPHMRTGDGKQDNNPYNTVLLLNLGDCANKGVHLKTQQVLFTHQCKKIHRGSPIGICAVRLKDQLAIPNSILKEFYSDHNWHKKTQ